ncbi:penicillin acylase family protein [Nocardioides sp.]|uniref:penicillin acylase family protein n=1 Tax=Nocardioides sp. TaxID=35761 RepID=UPI003561712A
MTITTPAPDDSGAPEAAAVTQSGRSRKGPWRTLRGWPRLVRWSTYVVMVVVLAMVAAVVTTVVLVRRPFPQVEGEAQLRGLEGEVSVVRDAHGIAQIYADSIGDLMRAQGFVHAQERFYEMDIRRHATAGRLAELFGEPALESDRFVRTMGWRRVAEQELALLKPETRVALEAYADGVNAYLEDRGPSQISFAYSVLNATGLGYRPEPWSAVDSLAWLKAMAWDLRGNMGDEIDRSLSLAAVGPERTATIYPAYDELARQPILSQGQVIDGVFEPDATSGGTREPKRAAWRGEPAVIDVLGRVRAGLDALPSFLGRGDALGSNSWVVDGDHSATGAPILANDPHLGVGMPGIWLQMGLHCRTVSPECPLDVSGFTFSGVPGVIIGHNADIAWGFTNLGPDVTDLYVEQVRGTRWRYGEDWRSLQTRTETIKVRGLDDEVITVRSTAHGPLLSDVSEDLTEVAEVAPVDRAAADETDVDYALALKWTALTPGRTADAIFDLNQASNWDEFRAAASSFEVPSQNLVYADRDGHIGYQAPGRIPIRKSGNDGRLPAAGWLPENDWTGDYVPFDGLPQILDPDEGVIVTANQAVIGDDYPYFLTDDWDHGYRAQRIRDLLDEKDEWTVAEMARLQLENQHPLATALVPYLLAPQLRRGYERDGQDLLRSWDFDQDRDSAAAAYFNVVWRNVLELTFHDELPEDLWPDGGDRWVAAVSDLLRDPRNGWWDSLDTEDVVEDRDDILRQALIDGRNELTARQALQSDEWNWGFLHELQLREPTLGDSGVGPLEWIFNRDGWEIAGGPAAVDATGWDASAEAPYVVTTSPSMRMVVSLDDLDQSRWINLTGVSGHPFNDHYTDQTDLWARGETLPWLFDQDAVTQAGEHTLTLVPAAPE